MRCCVASERRQKGAGAARALAAGELGRGRRRRGACGRWSRAIGRAATCTGGPAQEPLAPAGFNGSTAPGSYRSVWRTDLSIGGGPLAVLPVGGPLPVCCPCIEGHKEMEGGGRAAGVGKQTKGRAEGCRAKKPRTRRQGAGVEWAGVEGGGAGSEKGRGSSGGGAVPKKSTPAAPRRGGLSPQTRPKKSTPAAPGREECR